MAKIGVMWSKVLAILVKNNAAAWNQVSGLKSSIFPSPHSVLFSLLRGHYSRTGYSPRPVQVRRILLASGLPPDKIKRLAQLYKDSANQSGEGWDVDDMLEEYQERVYVSALENAVKCLSEPIVLTGSKESVGGVSGAREILYRAENEMNPAEEKDEGDACGNYLRQAETGVPPVISFPLFGDLFTIFRNELWLLSAFSGEGKTTLSLNLAVDAFLQGEQVLIISLETEPFKLKWRLACILSGKKATPVSINDVALFRLNEKDKEVFLSCLREVSAIKIRACTGTGFHEIMGVLRSEPKVTLVFVDNLNLMSARSKQFFDRISEGLKSLVKYTHKARNLTVIVLAQVNRAGHKEAQTTGKYSLTSLADSSEAERSPDGCVWILRADFLKSSVGVSKSRMLTSDNNLTKALILNPNTLVFSADEIVVPANGGGVQQRVAFDPASIDLGED